MQAKNFFILLVVLTVILILVVSWMGWRGYQLQKGKVSITTDKTEYEAGKILRVQIKNNSWENICFSSCYPYYLEKKNTKWESYKYVECHDFNGNGKCISPDQTKAFELTLPEVPDGLHRLAVPVCGGCQSEDTFREEKRFYSNEFWIGEKEEVAITTDKMEYEEGEVVKLTSKNNLTKSIWWLPDDCTEEPLDLFKYVEGDWRQIHFSAKRLCKPFPRVLESKANESFVISYEFWMTFFTPGKYKIRFSYSEIKPEDTKLKGRVEIYSNEFTIK